MALLREVASLIEDLGLSQGQLADAFAVDQSEHDEITDDWSPAGRATAMKRKIDAFLAERDQRVKALPRKVSVDLPDVRNLDAPWINVDVTTYARGLRLVRENLGADAKGRICVLTPLDAGEVYTGKKET